MNHSASSIRSSSLVASEWAPAGYAPREIMFIDPAVEAIDVLLASLRPGVQAVLLDADVPAPRQMARALDGREGIEAIHVVAHGAPGEVRFAAGTLTAHTTAASAGDLAALGKTRARLLLWSCNTGAGEAGKGLIDTLVDLTGMEVSASARLIGSAALGGNWELDAPVCAPLTAQGAAGYPATLGITINLNNASGTGTTAFTEQTLVSLFPSATFSTSGSDNNGVDSITVDLASPTSTMTLSLTAAAVSAASAAGITVSYNASTGTLTLSGSNETTTTWQSILQGVQYNDTSDAPTNPGTITVTAKNNTGSTATDTQAVSITAVNDAPVASGSATLAAIAEDSTAPSGATVSSLFGTNFTDVDGGTFAGIAISAYTADASKGIWQYSTNGGSSWATLGSASTSSALTLKSTDLLRFVPAANFNGSATALSANLIESGQTITSGATISLTGATGGSTHISAATVSLSETITAVNDAPVASGGAPVAAIAEDTANPVGATVSSLFATNFSDIDGDALGGIAISAYSVDAAKGNWQYSSNGGSSWTTLGSASTTSAVALKATDLLRFVPAANYNGPATALSANLIDSGQSITSGAILNLTGATGGTTHVSTAAVALAETITAVNDAPVLSAHIATIAYTENAAAQALLAGVSVSDADAPAGFAGGAVTVSLAGAITGDELRLAGSTVTLSGSNLLVGGIVIGAISAGGLSGGQTSVTISLNGSATTAAVNALLQALAFDSSSENPTNAVRTATVTFNDGGNTGSGGVLSDSAIVTINVTPVNDPAVLSAAVAQLTEANTAADISTSGQLTISDVDSPATFVAQSNVPGQYGIFSIDASGAWSYLASSAHDEFAAGQTYTDTFAVTSADGTATTVTINIAGTDDTAIIAGADTGAVLEAGGMANDRPGVPSASGSLVASDADGLALFVGQSDASTSYGRFSITGDGVWAYTLDDANAAVQALNDGDTLQDVITVATEDGTTHAINITITGSNDAPVIGETSTLIGDIAEDGAPAIVGQIVGADPDNVVLTYSGDGSGNLGSLVVDPDTGAWTYTLDGQAAQFLAEGEKVTETFAVTVTDPSGASDTKTVAVTITGANDAPQISLDTSVLDGMVVEDSGAAATGQILASDIDHGAMLSFSVGDSGGTSEKGEFGTLALDPATGAWSYTLDARAQSLQQDQTGLESFQVAVTDEHGASSTATVTIMVTGVNDAAVISGMADGALVEDASVSSVNGTLTIADPDNGEAMFQPPQSLMGAYGDFTFDSATGAWSYALDPARANPLAAGQVVHDTLTVSSVDGTASQQIDVTITGSNDAALISGTATGAVVEDGLTFASGTLEVIDPDTGEAAFQLPSAEALAGQYGAFSFDAQSGVWSYALDPAKADPLTAGQVVHDTLAVTSLDGTATRTVDVTITGSNDAASISGTATGAVIEDGVAIASGTLSVADPDAGEATFQPPAADALAGSYGTFTFDPASGMWSYALDAAKADVLAAGQVVHETLAVTSLDGTASQVIDVSITGTNDAPIISSLPQVGSVTENVAPSVSGQVTATDIDAHAVLVYSGDASGAYGTFSVESATGKWIYTLDSRAEALAGGETKQETFNVTATDDQGAFTSQEVTISITGTDDAALLSSGLVDLVEGDTAAAISTSGQLTISDVDSPAIFVPQTDVTGAYGTFSIDESGAWTYTASSAHDEFLAGQIYTDSFGVKSADGTATSVTINITGTNDAAVLSPAVAGLTEADTAAAISTSGQLSISDIDSPASFIAQSDVAGAYGSFSIDASGAWTYTASTAHDEFAAGQIYTDSFTVTSADGTATSVTIAITGTNDAAVLSPSVAELAEADTAAAISTSGQLAISDIDSPASFVPQADIAGKYGSFSIDTSGAWTYAASSAHDEFAAGNTYTDSFIVTSADGTATSVTVNITGTNDAPVVSGVVTSTAVEDGAPVALYALANASDVDEGAVLSVIVPDTLPAGVSYDGTSHSFILDPADAAYQHLANGLTATVTVSYGVSDGIATTAASVSWTVTAVNHAPVVTGTVIGVATEDGAISTLSALANASDQDTGTVLSVVPPVALPAGVSFDTGTQSFSLDPGNTAFQHLASGQTATVSVSYGVSDGIATTPASMAWTVTGTNDAPVVAGAVTGAGVEDGAPVALDALANASDIDDGTVLSVVVPGTLPAGVSYDAGAHSFVLDPTNAAYQHLANGTSVIVSLDYLVSDGSTATPASASWTVTGVNDAPMVTGMVSGAAVEDGMLSSLDALAKAADVDDGAMLSVVVPDTLPAGVTYDAATHSFSLDPGNAAYQHLAAGQIVTVSVSYGVSDGIATTPASMAWTVTGSNDAPVVSGAVTSTAVEDGAPVALDALANASDVDDETMLSVVVPDTLPAGVTYDAATHSFILDPADAAYQHLANGQTVTVTANYAVSDGVGTTPASVSWTVTAVNHAPVVTGTVIGAAMEDGAISTLSALANASDPDSGTVLSVVPPAVLPAGVGYDAATQSFSLDPSIADFQHLAAGQIATVSVSYGVSDGIAITPASMVWTVTGTNDAPVVSGAATSTAVEDGAPVALDALANASDVDDGTVLSVVVPDALPSGVSYDAGTHSFVLDPADAAYQHLANGQTVTVTANYAVSDGVGTTPASVSWTVTAVNHAPVVTGTVIGAAMEDGAISTLSALANASDPDSGTVLSVVPPASLPAGVSYNAATQSFSLDPSIADFQHLAAGQIATVSVSYGMSDGIAITPASMVWTVTGTNDAPVVSGAATSTAVEDGAPVALDALANASDVDDGTVLSVVVPDTLPAGVSYDAATHSFVLDPTDAAYQHLANGQTVTVTANYGVSDGVASTPASASWTVTAVNHAPVVTGTVIGAATEDSAVSTLNALANASDPDSGTVLSVVPPASLPAGVSYNAATHSFSLDPGNAAFQHLAAGQTAAVSVDYGVSDGIATTPASASWTITGTNDAAAISGTATGAVAVGGVTTTDGSLTVTDSDTGEAAFQMPTASALGGNYGNFVLDPSTGQWHYALDPAKDGNLALGQVVHDTLTVTSVDVTASQLIDVTVTGARAPLAPSAPDLLATADSGVSNADNITNVKQPVFTGTAEPGTTVTLYDGSTNIGSGVAIGGTWTITTSALADGMHTITAKSADAVGNLSAASTPLTVTIDTIAPVAPSAPDLLAASDTGASSSDNITTVTAPIFAGTAEVGSTVTLFDGSAAVGSAVTAANGTWTIMASSLAVGTHAMTAKAADAAGNVSVASSGLTVTITGAAASPSAPDLVTGSDSGVSNTDNITKVVRPDFTGTATPGNTVTLYDGSISIGTATANATTGKWTINATKLSDGVHTITATATDKTGNVSAASPGLQVTIDTVAPSAPSAPDLTATSDTGASNTDNLTSVKAPTFTGTAEAGATVAIYNGSNKVGSGTAGLDGVWTIATSAMANGVHVMTAKATDAAGNVSVASGALSITIDATAPAAPKALDLTTASDTGVSATDNITSNKTPTFTGTAEAASTVTLYDGSTVIGTGVATAGGTWSIVASSLTDGTHNISAKAADALGNMSASSNALAVTIDTTAPGAPVITSATTSTLAGTGEAGATITIRDGATTVGTTNAGSGGKWNWSFVASGSVRHLTAVETDKAGNISAASQNSVIVGTSGANVLTSNSGNDLLVGGAGADTFWFGAISGIDVITDFVATGSNHDIINFHSNPSLSSFTSVLSHATQVGSGVVISDGSSTLTLSNVTKSSLTSADFSFG